MNYIHCKTDACKVSCECRELFLRIACKKALHAVYLRCTQLTCKKGNYTCSYATSTSHRKQAIARNKARNLRVNSPAGCRLTYLQLAGEYTRGVIADCLQLQVILSTIAAICVLGCSCFRLLLAGIFTGDSNVFACKLHLFLPSKAGKFAC